MELKVIDNDIKLPLNDETKIQDQKCHICNRFVKTNIVVHYLEQHNQKVKIEGKNVICLRALLHLMNTLKNCSFSL